MATKITDGNHGDCLQGSPEKRIDLAPDGSLWTLLVTAGSNGKAKFFRSADGGNSWAYAAASDLDLGQPTAVPSFFIDADGYAHACWIEWNRNPQVVIYARGTPTGTSSTAPGWSWTQITVSPASGRTGVDSDLVVFRLGTGWVAFVEYTIGASSSGGSQVARVNITSNGTLSVGSTTIGPPTGTLTNQYGSLEFAHTGDGKTPAAAPHLFLATGVQATTANIALNRATYSGGVWTWGTPLVVDTGNLLTTALCTIWDGSRLMTAYSKNSATILVWEWDGVAGSATARNPPAAPGGTGNVLGLSMSCDPSTGDIYLAYYDATDGDIRWSKFTRATVTWSAWAVAVTRTASADDGKVQLVRHPSRDSIDMIYANGSGSSWQIYSQQLQALVRAPSAPTLISPPSGANLDLATGATFVWQYNPVSPGDTQQAWAFQRINGATTEYYNNTAQTWGGSILFNTTVPANPYQAVFPAGKWTTGTTYTWAVETKSSTGANSAMSTTRTVTATTAPVVAVTAPQGIVYSETSPLVTWTYTGLDAQRDYQVLIYVEAVGITPGVTMPLWDSGVVSSAIGRSARVAIALTNGVTYRAYVRATSVTAVSSNWVYQQFTISTTPPSGPLVEVLTEISFETNVPRARLEVLGQSSFLSNAQNDGSDGWENDANTTVAQQHADSVLQLYDGVSMTSIAAGTMGIRTKPGSPPLAPFGQTQPLGPLSFPVVAGLPYTVWVALRCAATSRSARVSIRWYDADDGTGALISTTVGLQVAINSIFYVAVSVTDVAPIGAVLARVVVEILGPTAAGEVFYMAFPSFQPGRTSSWQPGGNSTTQTFRIERSDDGGVTWNEIVRGLKPTLAQQAVYEDRLMPFVIDVSYRAFTDIDNGFGASLESSVSPIATIAIDADRWAIRDPSDDTGEYYAYVTGHDRNDDEQSSVHRPSGRRYPIVDTEGLQAATGTLTIFVPVADIDRAFAVLYRTVTFTIQSPSGKVYVVRTIRRHYNIFQLRHQSIQIPYVDVEPGVN